MLPKTSRPENPWQTEELATLTPFSFLGSLLTALLLSPKVLFVQVEKQLEQQRLSPMQTFFSRHSVEQPAPVRAAFSSQIPGGPLDLNQMTAC